MRMRQTHLPALPPAGAGIFHMINLSFALYYWNYIDSQIWPGAFAVNVRHERRSRTQPSATASPRPPLRGSPPCHAHRTAPSAPRGAMRALRRLAYPTAPWAPLGIPLTAPCPDLPGLLQASGLLSILSIVTGGVLQGKAEAS